VFTREKSQSLAQGLEKAVNCMERGNASRYLYTHFNWFHLLSSHNPPKYICMLSIK